MRNCIVCDANDFKIKKGAILLECQKCSFTSANLDLESLDLSKVYIDEYFNGMEYDNYLMDELGIKKNFKKRLKKNFPSKTQPVPKEILEIGCAYGLFGQLIKSTFPTTKYTGIDVAKSAVEWGAKNLDIQIFEADYLNFVSQKEYDHIFLWDVIEHLKYPELFIEKAYKELEIDGEIHITTGDINSLLARLQGSKWRMIHPPTHLHYFSSKTLALLLEKYGFEIKSISYPTIWRSAKQIYFSLFILNKKQRKIHTHIYNFIPRKFFLPLNTFDIFLITAKKVK